MHGIFYATSIFEPYRAYPAQTDKSLETFANLSMGASPIGLILRKTSKHHQIIQNMQPCNHPEWQSETADSRNVETHCMRLRA
ncbi:MAG: hypothetical protein ACK5IJ_05010 [Mangrovibacterium sp.]